MRRIDRGSHLLDLYILHTFKKTFFLLKWYGEVDFISNKTHQRV